MRGRARRAAAGPGVVDVLEQAAHLIRVAPPSALAAFYLGSVPFVLGLLYFVSDMARSATAHQRAAEGALRMALLYLWMKGWHAAFARRLQRHLAGTTTAPPPESALEARDHVRSRSGRVRACLTQIAVQPWSLFVLPASLAIGLPFGWAYAYYQSLSVEGDAAAARRQAALWPVQNHLLIGVLALFTLCVFVNVMITILLLPSMAHSLLGIDTPWSRGTTAIFNSTTTLIALAITWLLVAPLARAAYVVRCFHGDAVRSGIDLAAALATAARPPGRTAAVALLAALILGGAGPALAAPPAPPGRPAPGRPAGAGPAAPPAVEPQTLDRAITRVLERREFDWRLPRRAPPAGDEGILGKFFDAVAGLLGRAVRACVEVVEKVLAWLGRLLRVGDRLSPDAPPGTGWLTSVQLLLGLVLCAAGGAAALLFWRTRRRATVAAVAADPLPARPDEGADDSAALDAPPDAWLLRAAELARAGRWREALRAVHLAHLALLAGRRCIDLARFKSNRDYEVELRRRVRERPEVVRLFRENAVVFEKVWYGRHEATEDLVRTSMMNLERMRADAPT